MKIFSKIYLLVMLCSALNFAGQLFAGCNRECACYPFYLQFTTGGSFSMESHIKADPTQWDPAPEGYNAGLKQAALFEGALGYRINSWLSTSASWAWRGHYHYEKHQTSGSGTPFATGNKTRHFDLDNTSVMANLFIHGSGFDCLTYRVCSDCVFISPFIGAGVGLANNRLYDFHSVADIPDAAGFKRVTANMWEKSRFSIAAQATVGLALTVCERTNLELGYRFYYGGTFKSNNYLTTSGTPAYVETIAWEGTLKANELFVSLAYDI